MFPCKKNVFMRYNDKFWYVKNNVQFMNMVKVCGSYLIFMKIGAHIEKQSNPLPFATGSQFK